MAYKEKKRERRIRDEQRMLAKAYHLGKIQGWMKWWADDECVAKRDKWQRIARKMANNLAICSCVQCGNPRQFGDRPLKEKQNIRDLQTFFNNY